MLYIHNWGLPRVNIPPPPFQEAYKDRFLASDIGWFSSGLSTDDSHYPRGGGFFPEFLAMRASLPHSPLGSSARRALNKRVRQAIFDLATLRDRSFGGTTMVLHVDGMTVPGAPTEPEYLVANMYLPPAFIDSHPGSYAAFPRGYWCTHDPTSRVLVPPPAEGSSHYEFLRRRMGDLQQILTNQHIPPTSTSSSVSTLSASAASSSSSLPAPTPISTPLFVSAPANGDKDYEVGDDFESVSVDMLDALKCAAYAESWVNEAQCQIDQLEEQIAILMTRVEASDALSANLQVQLSARRTPHSYRTNALDQCFTELEPDSLAVSIRLVMRAFPPAKWYEELLRFDIPGSRISHLIDAAS
ncbi:hypothetical protein C8R45DRAFT_935938 [Mycena sanguinolenta]|nr:hypothetical protein C8R45DRAFT_935938 [Mycena sanguinolenta]